MRAVCAVEDQMTHLEDLRDNLDCVFAQLLLAHAFSYSVHGFADDEAAGLERSLAQQLLDLSFRHCVQAYVDDEHAQRLLLRCVSDSVPAMLECVIGFDEHDLAQQFLVVRSTMDHFDFGDVHQPIAVVEPAQRLLVPSIGDARPAQPLISIRTSAVSASDPPPA